MKVEFEYAELAEIISEVKLYSENQKEVINLDVKKLQKEDSFKTNSGFDLNVNMLPKGIYYLNFVIGGRTHKDQIIVEK